LTQKQRPAFLVVLQPFSCTAIYGSLAAVLMNDWEAGEVLTLTSDFG
jgi:hypothetical protein